MSRQSSANLCPNVRLREGLDREGLTQDEFAWEFGVTPKTIHRWLSGESRPRRRHARKLAERFGGHWTDYGPDARYPAPIITPAPRPLAVVPADDEPAA